MKQNIKHVATAILLLAAIPALTQCAGGPIAEMNASTVNPEALANDSRRALDQLYRSNASARALGPQAKGILVFPNITKGGFILGGMGGNGALIRPDGTVRDFYQTAGASYGLQAGVQRFGYALFLMDDGAVANLNRASGWEIGSSPSLVVVDEGVTGTFSTTTANRGTVAFFFNQRGLMGGLSLEGSKITRINPRQ